MVFAYVFLLSYGAFFLARGILCAIMAGLTRQASGMQRLVYGLFAALGVSSLCGVVTACLLLAMRICAMTRIAAAALCVLFVLSEACGLLCQVFLQSAIVSGAVYGAVLFVAALGMGLMLGAACYPESLLGRLVSPYDYSGADADSDVLDIVP